MNILVSACLLGVECRYDGTGTANQALLDCLDNEKIHLIPVCPEVLGGLPTPRTPCEIERGRVVSKDGTDCTAQFEKGAAETLKLARLYRCDYAILKDRSPSCGCCKIYDGTFTGTLADGSGVTAELLARNGMKVINESNAAGLLAALNTRE
jgi:uncharacterized protein YbbK (DUF523 family)